MAREIPFGNTVIRSPSGVIETELARNIPSGTTGSIDPRQEEGTVPDPPVDNSKPTIVTLSPPTAPEGYVEATDVKDVYSISPRGFFNVAGQYFYPVGSSEEVYRQAASFFIRNKTKSNRLNVGILLPQFLKFGRVIFSSIDVERNTEPVSPPFVQNGRLVIFIVPAGRDVKFEFEFYDIAGINLASQRRYTYSEALELYVKILDVAGPVYVESPDDVKTRDRIIRRTDDTIVTGSSFDRRFAGLL